MNTDRCQHQLHRAGWSLGEASFVGAAGPVWVVCGTNGENVIKATGTTSTEAWLQAVGQARSMGMLRCRETQ